MNLRPLLVTIAAFAACANAAQAQAPEAGGRGGGGRGAAGGGRGGRPALGPCINAWGLPKGCEVGSTNPHDLTGVWTGGGNMVPNDTRMTPAGEAKFLKNLPSFGPRMVPPALGNDPMGKCDPLGLIRNIANEVAGRSYEFAQLPDRVIQFFEWAHQYRTIWTDGRTLPKGDPELRWNGYSVGKWDGNTFVVDSLGFDDRTWLNNLGHAHTDQMRVQERYTRVDRDTLTLSVTITDPAFYTAPIESGVKMLRLNAEKTEEDKNETFCVPSEEEAFNKGIRDPAAGK